MENAKYVKKNFVYRARYTGKKGKESINKRIENPDAKHYCYILSNPDYCRFTYNGYTTCPQRRIRQHNQEIQGGAVYTKKYSKSWEFVAIVYSTDFTWKRALSFEWSLKYPDNKRPRPACFQGVQGRLDGLLLVLKNQKFNYLSSLDIYIKDELLDGFSKKMNETFDEFELKRYNMYPISTFDF